MKTTYKRLSRSSKNKILGGVASGLGVYFNIDPTVVRAVFIILTVVNGASLLVYALLWVILPIDKNVAKNENITADLVKENLTDIKGTITHVANEVKKTVQGQEEKKK